MSKQRFTRTDQARTNSIQWLLKHLNDPKQDEDIPHQMRGLLKELIQANYVIMYYIDRKPTYVTKHL